MASKIKDIGIDEICRFLPHRTPFLLVDRILEIDPGSGSLLPPPSARIGTRVVALKSVSYNEPYFQGHFPGNAIVPGVLIIETMAQAASFCVYPSMKDDIVNLGSVMSCILVGVDHARFRRPVVPGDQMRIEAKVTKSRGRMLGFHADVFVDDYKAAEADILANMLERA